MAARKARVVVVAVVGRVARPGVTPAAATSSVGRGLLTALVMAAARPARVEVARAGALRLGGAVPGAVGHSV